MVSGVYSGSRSGDGEAEPRVLPDSTCGGTATIVHWLREGRQSEQLIAGRHTVSGRGVGGPTPLIAGGRTRNGRGLGESARALDASATTSAEIWRGIVGALEPRR